MSKREVINFNTEWLYIPENLACGCEKTIDESKFELVSVPHANTILKHHKGDEGRSFLNDIEDYRFISCYRKHFTLGEEYKGKKVRVRFEAVATVAQVFVNGNYVGGHKGAYTPFELDITDHLLFGEDNVISVRVDSTQHKDIPPEGYQVDYCVFGGIVRNVSLIVTNKAYI